MIRIAVLSVLPILPLSAGDPPNPQLLPTTRELHGIITQKPDPAPAEMKPYEEEVPLAGGATYSMLPVPGGEFVIGSPESEAGRKEDEGPQRKIKIEPFWMGKVEVTWDLYRPFMENGMARNKDGTLNRDSNLSTSEPPVRMGDETLVDTITQPTPPYVPMHFEMGDGYSGEFPAVGMTQHAASKFCEWLSGQTGRFYRLPTEAEWEYAARAGTQTAYHFGDDPAQLGEYAWFAENSQYQYQKVGTKKPNPWGLHDMHGNVAEHVLDQYVPEAYAKVEESAVNPWIPAAERYPTAVRGGHWDADPADLRSAVRQGSTPAWKVLDPQIPKSIWYFTNAPFLGFRVVRPLSTPDLEAMHRFWNMGPGPTENDPS
jgi:formylglycine-generating enzyme required for sulfatase activity